MPAVTPLFDPEASITDCTRLSWPKSRKAFEFYKNSSMPIPMPFSSHPVRGKQDADKQKWHELLSWMEALNARADYHATDCLDRTSLARINQTDMTSEHATHLRKAVARSIMIKSFLKKHYGKEGGTLNLSTGKCIMARFRNFDSPAS
jgi:hypothetical protein